MRTGNSNAQRPRCTKCYIAVLSHTQKRSVTLAQHSHGRKSHTPFNALHTGTNMRNTRLGTHSFTSQMPKTERLETSFSYQLWRCNKMHKFHHWLHTEVHAKTLKYTDCFEIRWDCFELRLNVRLSSLRLPHLLLCYLRRHCTGKHCSRWLFWFGADHAGKNISSAICQHLLACQLAVSENFIVSSFCPCLSQAPSLTVMLWTPVLQGTTDLSNTVSPNTDTMSQANEAWDKYKVASKQMYWWRRLHGEPWDWGNNKTLLFPQWRTIKWI